MARAESRLGLDLTSLAPIGLVLRESSTTRGSDFAIERAWAHDAVGVYHVGGSWLTPPAWPDALRGGTAATSIGVLDAADSVTLAATDQTDGRDAVRQANNLAEQITNVSTDVGFVVPVPRADHRWANLQTKLEVANVLQVAEWATRVAPDRHPLIDVPVVALLRALHTFRTEDKGELFALVHVDLWRTYVILRQAGTDRQLVVHRQGIAHIAAQVAGRRRIRFDECLRALMRGEGWDDVAHAAFARVVETPFIKARRRLEDVESDRRGDTLGLARSSSAQLKRVLLSGPLADIEGLAETLRGTTRCPTAEAWRPAAILKGAAPAVKQYAGRYTIALGHALNERGLRRIERLPLDYTIRIPTSALAIDARDPLTVVASEERRGRQRGQSKRIIAPLSPERERQLKGLSAALYGGVVLVLGAGLAYPTVQQQLLRRENGRLESDTLALAGDVLNLRNLQDETNLMSTKRVALGQLQAARADGARVFGTTSRAISRSEADVWLTTLKTTSRLEVTYEGTGRSPTAIASYLDGLRADTAVRGVALLKMTRSPKEPTWTFSAKVLLVPPDAPTPVGTTPVAAAPPPVAPRTTTSGKGGTP